MLCRSGAKRFIPLSFVVLSTLLVLYGCWPSAHQWHEPIDHGAAFSSWVYASHAAYRESASVSSVLPRGPAILDLPLFGGATASRDLTALPAFDATDRSAVSNVSATSLTRLRPAVQQLGTRVQRNSQVLLYGAGAGSVHGRDYVASYLSAARTNYSVALWFTHSGSVNALWRQYAQLSQRIGLRTISLVSVWRMARCAPWAMPEPLFLFRFPCCAVALMFVSRNRTRWCRTCCRGCTASCRRHSSFSTDSTSRPFSCRRPTQRRRPAAAAALRPTVRVRHWVR